MQSIAANKTIKTIDLFPYQHPSKDKIIDWVMGNDRKVINTLVAVVAHGKCLEKGTLVIKYDGSVVPVESLEVGDRLMSPAGTPETITSLARGKEMMYRVIPKGNAGFDEWGCNESHILSLVVKIAKQGRKTVFIDRKVYYDGDILNISVKDYLRVIADKPSYAKYLMLYRVSVDSFENSKTIKQLPLHPYVLGVWLGDGTHKLSVAKKCIEKTLSCVPDINWKFQRDLIIPNDYKYADKETRLELLAGLLDSDGYYSGCNFEFCSVNENFAKDVQFLARSLGFLSTLKSSLARGFGKVVTRYRVTIGGNNLETIPITRFDVQKRTAQKTKDYNINSFTLVPQGIGDYYGFTLDNTRLFLLGDFSVTHNTVCTIAAIDAIVKLCPKIRIWIVNNRMELTGQWVNEFRRFAPNIRVGVIDANNKDYTSQICVVQVQTLARFIDKIPAQYAPDVLFCDEAHEVAFNKVITDLKNHFSFKQINVTGTPVRHGMSSVQYDDLFPKKDWFIGSTPKELIRLNRWKVPQWYLASEQLAQVTAQRFSGMKINKAKGEYDETSQSKVMIDLLPYQLKEVLPKIGDRSVVWFCVDTNHAEYVYAVLVRMGRKVAFVSGDEKKTSTNVELPSGKMTERQKIVEQYRKGNIIDYVTVQTATTGFDAPIASVGVFLRLTLSVGLFVQMTGRILRQYPGIPEALLFDMVGNLGKHPFPEDIDWLTFNPSNRLFRDPSLYVCKHCNYRHDSIPVPIHSTNRRSKFLTSKGVFDDGTETQLKSPLGCHGCGNKVYFDLNLLMTYSRWQEDNKARYLANQKLEPFEGTTAGISIGKSGEYERILTPSILYQIGIWNVTEGEKETDLFKDKSGDFRKRYTSAKMVVSAKDKIKYMNEVQSTFMENCTEQTLRDIPDPVVRYRCALAYAYFKGYSPLWAYTFYDRSKGNPSDEIIGRVLRGLANHEVSKTLVKDWLLHHTVEYEKKHERRKAGLLKGWIGRWLNNWEVKKIDD